MVIIIETEKFIYDETEHIEDEEIEAEIQELKTLTLATLEELIAEYSKAKKGTPRRRVSRLLILKRLELVDLGRFGYALEEIAGALEELQKKTDDIDAIAKKHRHRTIGGLYTEKPAW